MSSAKYIHYKKTLTVTTNARLTTGAKLEWVPRKTNKITVKMTSAESLHETDCEPSSSKCRFAPKERKKISANKIAGLTRIKEN